MRRWTGCLVAVAGLGLAAGCERREVGEVEQPVQVERGRLGEEWPVEQEAPLEGKGTLGGEKLVDQEFYGTVVSLTPEAMVLRDDRGQQMTFEFSERTRFVREGVPVQPQVLREGAEVRTAYDERGGDYIASEITVYAVPR